ncbi:MAG: DUF4349 domain-containing protein [Lachnospiraceae bacterium]|nr:DUF4349 domain-containing protein [Lachnospiraceae bacterium]
MKKNVKMTRCIPAALAVVLLLAGCGSSSADSGSYKSAQEEAYYDEEPVAAAAEGDYMYTDDVYAAEEAYEEEAYDESAPQDAEIINENAQSSTRKLIKNVNLNVETEEFDKFLANIEQKVNSLGGYIEMSEISGRSLYNTSSNRHASITARVPNDKLDSFVSSVAEQSNITNKTLSTEDVTLEYADTQAHIESLKSEQKRLNDLITKAEDLDTLLTLEARLTEVSYQIESYERQIRSMDNKVDYSTIYIYADEVTHYTPVEEVKKSAGERIRTGFAENLYQIGNGFKEFGIGFVIGLPYVILVLTIIGLFALVIFLIVRAIVRAARRSAERNRAVMQQNMQNMNRPAGPAQPQGKPAAQSKPETPDNGQNKPDTK